MKRLQALRALRWNYRWWGAWLWLVTPGRWCKACNGAGEVLIKPPPFPVTARCGKCQGQRKRGYQRILSEPKQVIAEQEGAAA